jgi:DNA-binding LacI/PurR family transcriptional regulator
MNIAEIAKQAEVSTATVSRVINNYSDVSEAMRLRVRQVMRKSSYRPRMVRNRCTNLGIVVELVNPVVEHFTAEVLSGIAKYSFEQGVETSMLFLPSRQLYDEDLLKKIRERRCDAAIMISSNKTKEQLPDLVESGLPCILIAERYEHDGVGYVDTDPFNGALLAMDHLMSLGHRRIAFLAGPKENTYDHQQRLEGYRQAMAVAGQVIAPQWIVDHDDTFRTQEAGYKQARQALAQDPSITAIFANNDAMAYGAILACVESGRKVPEDISVIGFDDYPNSAFFNPPLTTIRQPLMQMGYDASRHADMLVRGVLEDVPHTTASGELLVRKSTAPVCTR